MASGAIAKGVGIKAKHGIKSIQYALSPKIMLVMHVLLKIFT